MDAGAPTIARALQSLSGRRYFRAKCLDEV